MGSLGLRLARPPFLAFDFSVRSVLARFGPATYFASLLLLVFGCVGVSPVGSTWSQARLRESGTGPPLTGVWCVEGAAPCRLCSFHFCFDFFNF